MPPQSFDLLVDEYFLYDIKGARKRAARAADQGPGQGPPPGRPLLGRRAPQRWQPRRRRGWHNRGSQS